MWLGVACLVLVVLALTAGLALSHQLTSRRRPGPRRSPAEYGLPFEEIGFVTSDGLTLRGWWIPAPGSDRAVIFLHGQGGSMDPDIQYAPAMSAAGLNVLMFDFRAHGRSEGTVGTIGYLERRDVLAALEWAKSRGMRRMGLLGFSMGGVVAILTAPLSPDVHAVVSDGGPARLSSAIAGRAHGLGLPYRLGRVLGWLAVAATSFRVGANLFCYSPVVWVSRLGPRPILFIHGGRDPYLRPVEFEELVARASAPKECWVDPEAGHRDVDRHQPEEYRRRVVEFFGRSL